MTDDRTVYGMLAEFETPERLVAAARRAREAGYRDLDAFTPFPVEELSEIFELRDRRVLWLGLFGGIFGFAIAALMQIYTNFDYSINVGGKPVYALSAFAVVTFELTVLFSALFTAFGMIGLNRLPRLNYPVFAASRFYLASKDRFFLCIKAGDAKFDLSKTRRFMNSLDPQSIELVPA